MGCRCKERGQAMVRGVNALARGNIAGAAKSVAFVGRTFAQDARSGALKAAATTRLAQLRKPR